MAVSDRNPSSSGFSLKTSSAPEEYTVPEVIITYRLRDREMLRKRKAEAQERDSVQWVMSKQQRKWKSRGQPKKACRGKGTRSRQVMVEPRLQPPQEVDRQSNPQVEAEPAASGLAPPEPVLVLTSQDLLAEMESEAAEGVLAARSQDLAGGEELLEAAGVEIPKGVNVPLEYQGDECTLNFPIPFP